MNCRDCPYIEEDFKKRIDWYEKFYDKCETIKYQSYLESPEEYAKEVEESCWCDKTGGKVWWYGQCSDAHSPTVMSNKVNKKCNNVNFIKHNSKISKKRERDWKHRNHAKKLANIYQYGWWPPYYYKHKEWVTGYGWYELQKPYYKRYYRGQRSKQIKKQCNRSVRRYKGKIPNGGSYKKIDEFWWEMH